MNSDLVTWLLILVCLRAAVVAALQALFASPLGQRYRVYDLPIEAKQVARERYAPLVGAAFDAVAALLLVHFGLFQLTAPSLMELAILLSAHILVVEPVYYGYHRLLHTRYLFKRHHFRHHLSTVTQPSTSFTFTFAERASYTALFSIPLFVANYFDSLSLVGLTIYLLVFDLLNSVGHLNCEFFQANRVMRRLFYTPSFHARHHTKFNCNYSLFMPVFDHLFKTADAEEEALHLRVRRNQPLKSLGERADQGVPRCISSDSASSAP